MGPGPFTPDPLGSVWPAPFPWLSFGFSGPVPGFSLTRTAAPATEPVDLATVKLNARVYHTQEDALFNAWIPAARRLLEVETASAFITQSWKASYPSWPVDGQLRIGIGPVQSIDTLQYYAPAPAPSSGTLTTLTEGVDYQVWLDYRPTTVFPYPGKYWPVTEFGKVPTVICEFTAGYGDSASDLPEYVVPAIMMMIAYWAENRGDEDAPEKLGMSPGVRRLIDKLSLVGYR